MAYHGYMDLQAPLTLFIDEAGSADFREPGAGECKKAFVVCAVSVPTSSFHELQQIIPRSATGKFLKSSHRDFNPALAITFADRLIHSKADVGAVLVDPGAVESIELARKLASLANNRRKAVRDAELTEEGKRLHPEITPHDLYYLNFLHKALLACLEVYSIRHQGLPSFLDIVVDTMELDEFQRQRFVCELRRICGEQGLRIGQFEWRRDEDEPLLLIPDLIGDILCREDRYRDAGMAAQKLWDAAEAGRFKFANKPPSKEGSPDEG